MSENSERKGRSRARLWWDASPRHSRIALHITSRRTVGEKSRRAKNLWKPAWILRLQRLWGHVRSKSPGEKQSRLYADSVQHVAVPWRSFL